LDKAVPHTDEDKSFSYSRFFERSRNLPSPVKISWFDEPSVTYKCLLLSELGSYTCRNNYNFEYSYSSVLRAWLEVPGFLEWREVQDQREFKEIQVSKDFQDMQAGKEREVCLVLVGPVGCRVSLVAR
jgi:hypothetical protein